MIKNHLAALAAAVALSAASFTFADVPTTAPSVTPYPLNKCVISGEELGGDMGKPVVIEYNGREIKFCCTSCEAKFKKDPEKYLKKIDAEASKAPTTAPN